MSGPRLLDLFGAQGGASAGAALCIPPVYAEHVGWQLRAALDRAA